MARPLEDVSHKRSTIFDRHLGRYCVRDRDRLLWGTEMTGIRGSLQTYSLRRSTAFSDVVASGRGVAVDVAESTASLILKLHSPRYTDAKLARVKGH